jgi:hypothetical protein
MSVTTSALLKPNTPSNDFAVIQQRRKLPVR